MIRWLIVCSVVVIAGCVQTVRFGDNPIEGLTTLTITPAETLITISDLGEAPSTIEYTAVGTFDDGSTRDVTAYVGWSVDNAGPGSFIDAGRYRTSQEAAGHVIIQAAVRDVAATAKLDVVATLYVVDDVFPPPVGAEALFAPSTPVIVGGAASPALLYPARETTFPQGLARVLFQYTPGRPSHDAFRLLFESDVLRLTVLTGADRWQPDSALWSFLARSHWGATTQLEIQAATTGDPTAVHATAPIPLTFSRTAPGGLVYYRSEATKGIMRAAPSATNATKTFPAEDNTKCAGCHALSRDGATMVLGYDGEKQQTVRLPDGAVIENAASGRPMGWATMSPDGARVLVAEKGVLTLLDARSGEPIGPDGGKVPLATKATHPDWSPDGRFVAVALATDVANMDVRQASIARIPYADGTWGQPEILVASSGDNNYFPRWSPDGQFIAYVHATTSSRGAPSAELRMIRGDGGPAIALRLASHRVGSLDDVPGLANTMPAWAPAGGDLAWLAFVSARPYGTIRAMTGPGQIWISAIDLALAARGIDPSAPAFWLPAQDIRVLNYTPAWARSVVQAE